MERHCIIASRVSRHGGSSPRSKDTAGPGAGKGKSAWITALVLIVGLTVAAAEETGEIHLVSDIWPPFTDLPSEPRLAIDLVQGALERAGVTAQVSLVEDFGVATQGLRDGTYDGSAAIWKSPERETFLLYSGPFLENRLVLVGRKGSNVSAKDLTELSGQRLALVESYDYGEAVQADGGPEVVHGRTDQENLGKLLAGEVDYLLVDDLLVQNARQYQPEEVERKLEIGSSPLIRRSLFFAVRRELPDAESIIDRFNAAIRKMVADGTYNRILQLNWIRVDLDGDGYLEYVLTGHRAGKEAPTGGYQAVPAAAAAASGSTEDKYWVDGQMYDSWDRIPERYKLDTLSGGPASPALSLFKVSF